MRLTTAVGRRNYAILLLLARLGLRAGEVIALQLEDIDWGNAQITIRSNKGQGWARLPLPVDVGEAIASYLKNDRPRCACRNVFVRLVAPYVKLSNSPVIAVITRNALEKAGVESVRKGSPSFPPQPGNRDASPRRIVGRDWPGTSASRPGYDSHLRKSGSECIA